MIQIRLMKIINNIYQHEARGRGTHSCVALAVENKSVQPIAVQKHRNRVSHAPNPQWNPIGRSWISGWSHLSQNFQRTSQLWRTLVHKNAPPLWKIWIFSLEQLKFCHLSQGKNQLLQNHIQLDCQFWVKKWKVRHYWHSVWISHRLYEKINPDCPGKTGDDGGNLRRFKGTDFRGILERRVRG